MFKLGTIGLTRSVIASIGALVISAAMVGAAVAPAKAHEAHTCLLVSHA